MLATRFSECQLQTMAALLMCPWCWSLLRVRSVGRDTGEGRDQAGQVRDDRFMEISHSECNELVVTIV